MASLRFLSPSCFRLRTVWRSNKLVALKRLWSSNTRDANVSQHIFNVGTSQAEKKIFFQATAETSGSQDNVDSYPTSPWSSDIDVMYNDIGSFVTEDPKVHRILDKVYYSLEKGVRSSEIVQKIYDEQYQYYTRTLPWLHRNRNIAYIQFVMNNQLGLAFDYIWNKPEMQVLMDQVVKELDSFTNLELLGTYLNLLYLGLGTEKNELLQIKIHVECLARSKDFSVEEMDIFGSIIRSSRDRMCSYRSCLPKLQSIIEDPNYKWTSKDLCHLSSVSTLYHFILSSELLDKIHNKIIDIAEDDSLLNDPILLSQLLRCSKRVRVLVEQNEILPTITPAILRTHIVRMSRAAMKIAPELEPEHIAEMCDSLKRLGEYSKEIADLFEERVMQLKNRENIKLADLSNLMFAFRLDSNYESKKQIANMVCTQLQNADVMILSDLASSISDSRLSHHAIAATYLAVIPNHVDNLFNFITRIYKIVTCIQNFRGASIQLRQQFAQALVSTYSKRRRDVFVPVTLAVIGSYVIPHCKVIDCEPLLSDIARSLPHWNIRSLYQLSLGLNRALSNGSKSLCLKLSPMVDSFYTAMMIHTKEIANFNMLHSIAMATIINTPQRDPNFTHQMMGLLAEYTKGLSSKQQFIQTLSMVSKLQYYSPVVYDNLTSFLVNEREDLHLERGVYFALIRALAIVGYLPADHEELLKLTLEGYNEIQDDSESIRKRLVLLRHLCTLQILPESQLKQLFTLEMVERVDQFLNESGKMRQTVVEDLMMELNRFVVIECPQLDIPWFHEDFCKKRVASVEKEVYENLAVRQFRAEVGLALLEIVDDQKFFKAKTYSPYYHSIDFELLTDKKGRPVPYSEVEWVEDREFQRHALLTLNKDNFCYDSHHLLGSEQVRKRHLQMLGYNVVDVSHFEWYSMGLADWSSKVELLEKKLRIS